MSQAAVDHIGPPEVLPECLQQLALVRSGKDIDDGR